MKAKYLITAFLTAAMTAPVLYAAEEEPEPKPPVERKEMRRRPRPPMRGPRDARRPSKELRDAVRTYRENPTEENKARVRAVVEKDFDATIQREEKRIAEMKSRKAEHIDRRLELFSKEGRNAVAPARTVPPPADRKNRFPVLLKNNPDLDIRFFRK